jgi:hypothetical protein
MDSISTNHIKFSNIISDSLFSPSEIKKILKKINFGVKISTFLKIIELVSKLGEVLTIYGIDGTQVCEILSSSDNSLGTGCWGCAEDGGAGGRGSC